AEDIVRTELEKLASASANVGNGAVLVTDPHRGEILAMVGSRNYWDLKNQGNVNTATTLQQPGSTIKVVNYAAALERGDFTAATVTNDTPVVYNIPGSQAYAPRNYDGIFHGFVPIRYALANSYNIPAVRTLEAIGIPTMLRKGRQMGIESWQENGQYGLSLTLGGADVTMLDMARVYGTLANNGRRVELNPILEVTDYRGRTLDKASAPSAVQAVNEEVAWIVSDILRDNKAREQAFGSRSLLTIPHKSVAVKTGTTNDKRDNWTIGFTPSYLVAAWVGNNDNTPMRDSVTSGITGATPIWNSTMAYLIKDKKDEVPPKPAGVTQIPCHFGRSEYFVKGTEPAGGRCAPIPTPTPTPTPTP
ncbi:penicillin-binding protein, partial [Candidatus Gottesmanbacteria bacterium]|nr:penicillin-binding protein [Candidatus Gottesmanbacteria bacterium]